MSSQDAYYLELARQANTSLRRELADAREETKRLAWMLTRSVEEKCGRPQPSPHWARMAPGGPDHTFPAGAKPGWLEQFNADVARDLQRLSEAYGAEAAEVAS